MRTTDIVLRLHGHDAPRLEIGNLDNYQSFYDSLRKAVTLRRADVVHKGDYFRMDQHLLPEGNERFTTFVLFREVTLDDDGDDALWHILETEASRLDFPEVRETDTNHQLIELAALPAFNDEPAPNGENEAEDILVRIGGTRAELEFDPSGAEGNAILYDRLAKLIYDKEAEVMYKGPRLELDENRDLFYSDDDFSVYVLFRSGQSYLYEDTERLWSHLASALREPSSATLLRAADNYQVVLLAQPEGYDNEQSNR